MEVIKCNFPNCNVECPTVRFFVKHLQMIHGINSSIQCLFENCPTISNNFTTLKQHFAKTHKRQDSNMD